MINIGVELIALNGHRRLYWILYFSSKGMIYISRYSYNCYLATSLCKLAVCLQWDSDKLCGLCTPLWGLKKDCKLKKYERGHVIWGWGLSRL